MRGFILFTSIWLSLQAYGQDTLKLNLPDSIRKPEFIKGLDGGQVLPHVTVSVPKFHSFQTQSIDLETTSSQSLGQTLQNVPGIAIKANGVGGLSTLSIGGFAGNHTAVIWKNLNLQNSMNGFADLRTIPTFLFSDVEVYKGAMSAPGGGGLGGSVNLVSASEKLTIFENPFNKTAALLQFGSFGQKTLGLKYANKFKRVEFEVDAFLDGVNNDFNYTHPSKGQTRLTNARFSQRHLSGSLKLPISLKTMLDLDFWYSNIYREIPPTLFEPKSLSHQTDENIRLNLQWKRLLSKRALWRTDLTLLDDDIQYNDSLRNIFGDNHSTLMKLSSQIQHYTRKTKVKSDTTKMIDESWVFGGSYSLIQANTSNYSGDIQQNLVAVFANWERRSNMGISTVLAGRMENFYGQTPITGQIDVLIPITKKLKLVVNTGRAFRFATLNDMYWAPGGNPDLKPESSWKQNIDFTYSTDRKKKLFSVLKFETSKAIISNWIAWAPGASGFWEATNYQNVNVQHFGLSNSSTWKNHKLKVHLSIAVSSTLSQIASRPNAGKQVPYIPIHQGSTSFSLHHNKWYATLSFNQIGTRFTNADNSEELPPYGLLDLKVGKPLKSKFGTFNINFQLNNLLNTEYFSTVAYPMPGRNYLLSLHFKPSKKQS